MIDLAFHLQPREAQVWRHYVSLHEAGRRKEALGTLAEFVEAVTAYDDEAKAALVEALCRQTVDVGRMELLHEPLLTRFVFPELRKGREQRKAPFAKRIALFHDRICSLRKGVEILGLTTFEPDSLLREAIEVDPSDMQARDLLIERLRRSLDYYVHEVPAGILVPPEQFCAELTEFRELVIAAGRQALHRQELEEWQLHCDAWTDYLSRRDAFESYYDYLVQHHPDRFV
jgi:hypothetical protein